MQAILFIHNYLVVSERPNQIQISGVFDFFIHLFVFKICTLFNKFNTYGNNIQALQVILASSLIISHIAIII